MLIVIVVVAADAAVLLTFAFSIIVRYLKVIRYDVWRGDGMVLLRYTQYVE